MKKTSRAKSIWRDEDQQDWDDVEQQLTIQDAGAQTQPKQKLTRHHSSLQCTSKESVNNVKVRLSEIDKDISDGINKDRENPKMRKTSANPKLSREMS